MYCVTSNLYARIMIHSLLIFRQANLAFRSLIDFSKYNAKDIPKLVPFPGSGVTSSPPGTSNSSSSDGGSSSSDGTKQTVEATDSDGQRSGYQSAVEDDYGGVQVNVVSVSDDDDDDDDGSSQEDDEQYERVHTYVHMHFNIYTYVQ